jgi:hypothetical protein
MQIVVSFSNIQINISINICAEVIMFQKQYNMNIEQIYRTSVFGLCYAPVRYVSGYVHPSFDGKNS